jgi:small subunit ribosomal protein S20
VIKEEYMPITKSAKKALRQSKSRHMGNLRYKDKMKALMKKALAFGEEKKREELQALLPALAKALDKAAKVGVLKKNTAARRKGRVARLLARLASSK